MAELGGADKPRRGLTRRRLAGWELGDIKRQARRRDLNLAVWLDAVPHTVPGTYAGPISWQSWRSSTRRVGVSCRGSISAAVPLRGLSDAGADLQLLRPGPNLLCRGVRSASPTLLASVCRTRVRGP